MCNAEHIESQKNCEITLFSIITFLQYKFFREGQKSKTSSKLLFTRCINSFITKRDYFYLPAIKFIFLHIIFFFLSSSQKELSFLPNNANLSNLCFEISFLGPSLGYPLCHSFSLASSIQSSSSSKHNHIFSFLIM